MSKNYTDLSPEENQRLSEAKKQHEEQLQASKNLENTIKQLAKNNSKNEDGDTSYTENRLAIREYSDSMRQSMSNETSKLFEQLENINVESRKQTKSEQRDNLKQLEVLRELSKNVQNNEQKIELQRFIDSTEQSIRANTNKFTSFMSSVSNNFGDIGAVLSGLNDSPLLSMGFAYFGNKITDSLSEKREQKYAVQEGMEQQLFELLQQREQASKKQEQILNELANRKENDVKEFKEDDSPITIDDDSLSKLSNKGVQDLLNVNNDELISIDNKLDELKSINNSINARENNNLEAVQVSINTPELSYNLDELSQVNTKVLEDLLETATYELIDIQSSIQEFLNSSLSFDKNHSQEPIQVPLNEDDRIFEQLVDINEKLSPLIQGLEERRREGEIYNDQLLNAIQNINKQSPTSKKDDKSILGNIFGNLTGFLNPKKLLSSIKNVFGKVFKGLGKTMLRVAGRLALPALIVGTLFSGVTEALDEYKKTGSVKSAVMGYFGGILDFITFGLFDTESLKSGLETLKDKSQYLFDTLMHPIDAVTQVIEGIIEGDWKKSLKGVLELNPLSMMIDALSRAFDYVSDSINNAFDNAMKDLQSSINDFKSNFKIPSFDLELPSFGIFEDDKKIIDSKRELKSVDNPRTNIRESINSVYKINELPMNKNDYSKAAKKLVSGENVNKQGINNFNNVNNVSNNQTIIAPLPTVHNNDFNVRRLNNNPY